MSQENVEVVRKPLRVREPSSRTLEQRLSLRFPRLAAAYSRLILRLPPGSRLRRTAVSRGFQLATEAFNRRDLDATLIAYHPDREHHPPREFVEAGFVESSYRGPAGFRKYVSEWSEVWGGDLRVEPTELIDLGDRIVALATLPGRAQASGLPLNPKWAAVMTLKDGKVISQQDYLDHAEALEAVGLRG
jgi:ketosteroid isomerase-like protein